jgi:hypothetical protein
MPERKPSWLCRACQDKFHVVCLDPSACVMDNDSPSNQVDIPEHRNHLQFDNIQMDYQPRSINSIRE